MAQRRILIGVDDSEASRRAVAYVGRMTAGMSDVRIRLFNVLPPVPGSLLEHGGAEDPEKERRIEEELHAEMDSFIERARQDAHELFDRMKAVLTEHGVRSDDIDTQTFVERIEIVGDIKEVVSDILEVAQADDFDTIVIGRGRLSRWREMFRHHVSDGLVRQGHDLCIWVVS